MRKLIAVMLITVPSATFAQMDDMTFLTEMSALAKAVALEEECQISIDIDAMMAFVTSHFEGRESEVLSQLDAQVSIAQYELNDASTLQKKLLCATTEKYVEKHNLKPAN